MIRNDGILDVEANRDTARGLLVVVPDDLSNRRDDRERLERRAADLVGRPLDRDRKLPRPGSDRSFTATLVGSLILDVASAPYALGYSPRMLQLQRRLANRPNLSEDNRHAGVARMTQSLLRAFVSALENQIDGDHDTHRELVVVATPATLADQIGLARRRGLLGD